MLSKIAFVLSICTFFSAIILHTDIQDKIEVQRLKLSHLGNYSNLFWPIKGIRLPVHSGENEKGSQYLYGLKGRYCESSHAGSSVFEFDMSKQSFTFGAIFRGKTNELTFDLEAQGGYHIKSNVVILTGDSYEKLTNFTYAILTLDENSGESSLVISGFGDKYHWYTHEACSKYKKAEFDQIKITN